MHWIQIYLGSKLSIDQQQCCIRQCICCATMTALLANVVREENVYAANCLTTKGAPHHPNYMNSTMQDNNFVYREHCNFRRR